VETTNAAPIERTAIPSPPIRDGLYSRRLNLVALVPNRIRLARKRPRCCENSEPLEPNLQ
jgi:hypothetical protein